MFGQQVERLRQQKKVTKTYLSKALGVTLTFFNQLEKGEKLAPNYDKVDKIAAALNLSSEERRELIRAAIKERFKKEDKGYFLFVVEEAINQLVKENNPMIIDEIMGINSELSRMPPDKRTEAIQTIKTLLRGMR
jgi:transcriptional regulator with XRE-family HTH domain